MPRGTDPPWRFAALRRSSNRSAARLGSARRLQNGRAATAEDLMLGFSRANHRPVQEHEAEGDIERIYHEIRQTLRVSGINLDFRLWAGYERFLPVLWNAVAPNAETIAFEKSADQL